MATIFSRFSLNKRRKEISLEDSIEKIQSGDTTLRNQVIENYSPFIASTVSSVCKRSITEYDDEFSIGLIAFNESLDKYTPEKGKSIIKFSETVVKNRVIDYIRKESSNSDLLNYSVQEISNDEFGENEARTKVDILEYNKELEKNERQDEIYRFQSKLSEFGLTMKDLLNQAPKHIDARINAVRVAEILVENDDLKDVFYSTKKLPIKALLDSGDIPVSRKTLERNRKYIISLAIILDNDFIFLKDYLRTEE